MKIELEFVVERVLNTANPAEQYVEALQTQDFTIPYRKGRLVLPIIDDDELRKFGPGLKLKVTVEG